MIEARFVGGFRTADRQWAESLGLGAALRIDGFLPHDQALAAMKGADALLLLIPRAGGLGLSVLSGKLFEYLAAERPVLALVPPEGIAADLLRSTGFARIADPDDVGAIRAQLEDLVEAGGPATSATARCRPTCASGSTAARAPPRWPTSSGAWHEPRARCASRSSAAATGARR